MLQLERVFHTNPHQSPYDAITWTKRTAEIKGDSGKLIFRQDGVEAPDFWSDLAVNVAVSKYFYGQKDTSEREVSVRQLIHRVARTIADWGVADGYFSAENGEVFYAELSALCLNQFAAFNSPVWFNVGLWHQYKVGLTGTAGNWWYNPVTREAERTETQYEHPQCSACFIQSVDDNMDSIMHLAISEAMLFKFGSGTGTNLSTIRSKLEKLSGGGSPSGPLSFLRIYDQVANVVKSGGKTRRAAKMNILNDWHGDIEEFIEAKMKEEKKAWALIEQGYNGSFNGEAYGSIMYQNENLSVRVSDAFMKRALAEDGDHDWQTLAVTTGMPLEKKDAKDLYMKMAEGAWTCGDPGIQFDSTIQKWHTCKASGRIEATNPCSEYVFLDNTACNLASLNLTKFVDQSGFFEAGRFKAAVRLLTIAQDILVDNSSYPTKVIAERSHEFRTLGLGYANLGALLMTEGLPYNSTEGRSLAAAITALMTGQAYLTSSEIARSQGAFPAYDVNRESMSEVVRLHAKHCDELLVDAKSGYIAGEALNCWRQVVNASETVGFRNAQVTVLAPTGTISFMMDCATTGIEPDIALVKYKTLAGGGNLKMVNMAVPTALQRLGYDKIAIGSTVAHIEATGTIEGAPMLKPEHLAVFDCALKPASGKRVIPYKAHIEMMAAVQPFVSGAISKTVNMPNEVTVQEIADTYALAWHLGLKCVAVYRDGSKRSQPVNTKKTSEDPQKTTIDALKAEIEGLKTKLSNPKRKKMPATRQSITHKFTIAGHEGYLTVGLFPDGKPGELFITMSKEGSTVGGLMDCAGTLTSLALQYGVPLETLVAKFSHVRFEPSGFTTDSQIRNASSIIDYVFRWLEVQFLAKEESKKETKKEEPKPSAVAEMTVDAPPCPNCGHITVRNGSCHKCLNCGESLGCS